MSEIVNPDQRDFHVAQQEALKDYIIANQDIFK